MATCFVMQPFDGGAFDKRYESIFEPAIAAANLDAYRVDRDPGTSIPIDDIERGIREADICLAEITLDNPNVWFELGYAIACKKEVVLVCSEERTTKFPFDIQHRTILRYSTESPQDYRKLEVAITRKIEAYLRKAETMAAVSEVSPVAKIEGLDHHEIVCLAAIAANIDHPHDTVSSYVIKNDMEKGGSTKVAASIAMASLLNKDMLDMQSIKGNYDEPDFTGYSLNPAGWQWILSNKDQFHLRQTPPNSKKGGEFDDDIPF